MEPTLSQELLQHVIDLDQSYDEFLTDTLSDHEREEARTCEEMLDSLAKIMVLSRERLVLNEPSQINCGTQDQREIVQGLLNRHFSLEQ